MKFLDKFNLNSESKIYLSGVIFSVIALFLITGIVFLILFAAKLNIVMTQPADETFSYFLLIMDRIIAILTILAILPLTIYQIFSKNKSQLDTVVSMSGLIIFIIILSAFLGGEKYVMQKYTSGDLNYSKMFCSKTIETKTFDYIITKQGQTPPITCQTRKK